MNHVIHPLSFADISIFYRKSTNFAISRNTDVEDCIFTRNFSFFLIFFESLKVVLIHIVAILMISPKMATLGLLKIKVFGNKGYEVMICVHDATSNILSRYSNYIIDAITWTKFSNSTICMREVIITSILKIFDPKEHLNITFFCWSFFNYAPVCWSSLFYNTSARNERQDSDTIDLYATRMVQVQHEYNTSKKLWFW